MVRRCIKPWSYHFQRNLGNNHFSCCEITATGTIRIQLTKLSVGLFYVSRLSVLMFLEVITTGGPHNFEVPKSRGARKIYDHNEPEVGEKIQKVTKHNLKCVLDAISLPLSLATSATVPSTMLLRPRAKYTAILPVNFHDMMLNLASH
ncbi:TOXD protein [Rutstroemia sp. NJR-2017a BVV2]|nr:TOXD protein [Rutstroemia sp. NJR-2017a BVV2]